MRIARASDPAIHGAGEGKRGGRNLHLHLRPGRAQPLRGAIVRAVIHHDDLGRESLQLAHDAGHLRGEQVLSVAGGNHHGDACRGLAQRPGRRDTPPGTQPPGDAAGGIPKRDRWFPASRSDEQVTLRLRRAGTVRLPEIERLERERGRNRVHVRNTRAVEAAETDTRHRRADRYRSIGTQPAFGLRSGRPRDRAAPRRPHRRTGGCAAIGRTRRSARTPGRATASERRRSVSRREERRRTGASPARGKSPSRKYRSACSLSTTFGRSGWPGRKSAQVSQRVRQNAIVKLAKMRVAGSFPKVPPSHRRLQLVTTGRARPTQRVAFHGLLAGKGKDRMITVRTGEVSRHGFAQRGGHLEALFGARGAPGREQTADDDPAIEEVSARRGVGLERHGLRLAIPGGAGPGTAQPAAGVLEVRSAVRPW